MRMNIIYEKLTENLVEWIRDWFDKNGKGCNAVIGLSGGKDSTVVAALCVKALGKERVIGVALPEEGQSLNDADKIAEYFGIRFKVCNIGKICTEVDYSAGYGSKYAFDGKYALSKQAQQNIPPRVRMMMLYAISQTENGRVSCNCNLSEDWIGYATRWGDNVGDFAPLANLTVTDVKEIGRCLGIPSEWVEKVPDDGLPHSSPDEEKFGFTYDELDKYITSGIIPEGFVKDTDILKKDKIDSMHEKNLFKLHMPDSFKL